MPRIGRRELVRRHYEKVVWRAERQADEIRELERELRRQRRACAEIDRHKRVMRTRRRVRS